MTIATRLLYWGGNCWEAHAPFSLGPSTCWRKASPPTQVQTWHPSTAAAESRRGLTSLLKSTYGSSLWEMAPPMAPPGFTQTGSPQIRHHKLPGRADVRVSMKAEPCKNLVQRRRLWTKRRGWFSPWCSPLSLHLYFLIRTIFVLCSRTLFFFFFFW